MKGSTINIRWLLFILLIFFAPKANAQADSSAYFISQLKENGVSDSMRSMWNVKLAKLYNGKYDIVALKFARAAYSIAKEIKSPLLLHLATECVSIYFFNRGNLDSSLWYSKQSLNSGRETGTSRFVFNALNILGNICIKKELLTDAKKYLEEAMQITKTAQEIPDKSKAWLNMSGCYFASLQFKKSLDILLAGKEIARQQEDIDNSMRINSSLGLVYVFLSKPDSGHYYQLLALDYFEKKGLKKEKAIALLRMCTAYGLANNLTEMEKYSEKAIKVYRDIGDLSSVINGEMAKVNFFFRAFQFSKCLAVLKKVEPIAIKQDHKEAIAFSFIYRAGIFSIMGDTIRAIKYYELAEKMNNELQFPSFSKMNMITKAVVMGFKSNKNNDSLVSKALHAVKDEIPENQLESSLQSISLNKSLMLQNREDFVETYKIFKPEDSLTAENYFDSLISKPIDSNLNIITSRQLLDLETKYRTKLIKDSLNYQTQLTKIGKKQKTNLWLGIISLSLFLLLISFLLFRLYRQKKKISKEKKAVQNLTGILKHETSRQFGDLKRSIVRVLKTEQPKQQVSKAVALVKTYEMLYSNLFISDGLATISLKNALEKMFEYHCENNTTIINPVFNVHGGEDIMFNKSDYLFQYINELMANSFEHAFTNITDPAIDIYIRYDKPEYEIIYQDNGIGFPVEKQNIVAGKGMHYIKAYATQNLNGKLEINGNTGTKYKLTFNENNI